MALKHAQNGSVAAMESLGVKGLELPLLFHPAPNNARSHAVRILNRLAFRACPSANWPFRIR